jgi:hypothetical protein
VPVFLSVVIIVTRVIKDISIKNIVATTFVHHVIKYMRKQKKKKKAGYTAMTATVISMVNYAMLSTHRLQV